MNKYSIGLALGLGSIIISYFYYKNCKQENNEAENNSMNTEKIKKKITFFINDNDKEKEKENKYIEDKSKTSNEIVKDILDDIIDNIVDNSEKNKKTSEEEEKKTSNEDKKKKNKF